MVVLVEVVMVQIINMLDMVDVEVCTLAVAVVEDQIMKKEEMVDLEEN